MNNFWKIVFGLVVFFIVSFLIAYMIPSSRVWIREYIFDITYIDEQTDYENRKVVEDTARATIVNYNNYKNIYETYIALYAVDQDPNTYSYAIQAFTAANNQATIYNEYIQKNRYVWEGNLPPDIPETLSLLRLDLGD